MAKLLMTATVAGAGLAALAAPGRAAELPESLRAMLQRQADLGLERFPIGFWNYTNLNQHAEHQGDAAVEEWDNAGFTVTMTPSFDASKPDQVAHMRRMLDKAQSLGMKLILCDPRCNAPGEGEGTVPVPADQAERIAAAVADFGGHPALFGFHIGDEPGASNNDAYFACHKITKEAAPRLHPFLNLLPWHEGAEARVGYPSWDVYLDAVADKANVDFYCWDCYSQMNPGTSGWDMYYKNLRLYREAAWRHGTPFWTTVLSVGHFRYRCPNFDELRWQFNTSICSGASGILWFFYYMREPHSNYRLAPVDEHWDRTQGYYDLRRIQKSFHRFYGDLFLRLVPTRVTFSPAPFGGGQAFAPNELVSALEPDSPNHPVLLGEFVNAEGQRYVMLVNGSTTDCTHVALTFPGEDVRVYSPRWEGGESEGGAYCADRTERLDDGLRIWHFLAPGQEAVYRVDSAALREAAVTTQ